MPQKLIEVMTFTRPSIDIPFHPNDSIFHSSTERITDNNSHRYWIKNYVETGKSEIIPGYPRISEDGLTLIMSCIYNDITYMEEAFSDTYWLENDDRIGTAWRLANNIKIKNNYYFID